MGTLNSDDPEVTALFQQAMEIWLRELPDSQLHHTVILVPMNGAAKRLVRKKHRLVRLPATDAGSRTDQGRHGRVRIFGPAGPRQRSQAQPAPECRRR